MSNQDLLFLTQLNDPFEPLISTGKPQKKTFLQSTCGNVVIYNGNEILVKLLVLNFLEATTPLNEFLMDNVQRKIDWVRVDKMSHIQEEEFKNRGRFGIASTIITCGKCDALITPNNPFGLKIIDGQHRRGVWEHINKFDHNQLINIEIIIKISTYDNYDKMVEDFQIINDNWVPVSKYYLKHCIREIVDGVLEWFIKTYEKSFFKKSDKPIRPHLSKEEIKNKLSNSERVNDIIEASNGNIQISIQNICSRLYNFNNILKNYTPIQFKEKPTDRSDKLLELFNKCHNCEKPTYFGMIRNCGWIEQALNTPYEDEISDEFDKNMRNNRNETDEASDDVK